MGLILKDSNPAKTVPFQFMFSTILFDKKVFMSLKKHVNDSLSIFCLFDGYLTVSTSYPQFT
jgi:hypothetical protein